VARINQEAAPAKVVSIPRWWADMLNFWLIKRVIDTAKPDIVHTHLGRPTNEPGLLGLTIASPRGANLSS
jgi:hypothetical protein